jgi:hypothetical protein
MPLKALRTRHLLLMLEKRRTLHVKHRKGAQSPIAWLRTVSLSVSGSAD